MLDSNGLTRKGYRACEERVCERYVRKSMIWCFGEGKTSSPLLVSLSLRFYFPSRSGIGDYLMHNVDFVKNSMKRHRYFHTLNAYSHKLHLDAISYYIRIRS